MLYDGRDMAGMLGERDRSVSYTSIHMKGEAASLFRIHKRPLRK